MRMHLEDRHCVTVWLSELDRDFSLSVTSVDHLLVIRWFQDPPYLEIYNKDAELLRMISLSYDFTGPLVGVQKPNGEFVLSHESHFGPLISILDSDGKLISQPSLDTDYFQARVQLFVDTQDDNLLVTDTKEGNRCLLDMKTLKLSPIDCLFEPNFAIRHTRSVTFYYDGKRKQLIRIHRSRVIFLL